MSIGLSYFTMRPNHAVPGYPGAIETRSLPTLTRSYPRRFTLITRTARARASYLAALPSTRAIPDRDVFYVAWPAAPFARPTHSRRIVVQR
jgi:hypothetical protein